MEPNEKTKMFLVLAASSMGFISSTYVILAMLIPAGAALIAQQQIPEFSPKDIATLGTSGIFASFMCWLHVRSSDRFDAKLERKDRIILKMLETGNYHLPANTEDV